MIVLKQPRYVFALLFLLGVGPPAARGAEPPKTVTIKLATVAPEGSSWMAAMDAMATEVEKATGGAVRIKIFAGQVSGDETTVIKKIRFGQLQAGGFTGMGLGEILPEVRVLELPFFYRDYAEGDHVKGQLEPRFERAFEEKGFVLLGWADTGFVHIFSKQPIRSVADFQRGAKAWVWDGDVLAMAAFEAFEIHPIPLSLADVLTSLSTGLVDTVYNSPLALIAMQWHGKLKYMIDLPIVNAISATLVSKKTFDQIEPAQQKIVREVARRHLRGLMETIRKDNEKAKEALRAKGIEFIAPGTAERESFVATGVKAADRMVGQLFDQALLDEARRLRDEFRAQAGK